MTPTIESLYSLYKKCTRGPDDSMWRDMNVVCEHDFRVQINRVIGYLESVFVGRDESHDINHSLRVYENCLKIMISEDIVVNKEFSNFILVVSMCHDVPDHKYVGSGDTNTKESLVSSLREFLMGNGMTLKLIDIAIILIDNISWSKEMRGENNKFKNPFHEMLRRLIQDADWLDALGSVGLERCIQYTTARKGKVPEDVCQHIKEKLLLIPEHMHFESSQRYASEETLVLRGYLEKN